MRRMMSGKYENGTRFVVYQGYEIPVTTGNIAKAVLRKLKRTGVVFFEHDDGLARSARQELVDIASNIGLTVFEEDYRIVLMDNNGEKKFKMNNLVVERCAHQDFEILQ